MDAAAENPVVRRHLLEILQDAVNRSRGPQDDISTYVAESLLQRILAMRGFPLALERMRAQLFWLNDRRPKDAAHGYAKFRETRGTREKYVLWRITDLGTDVLEGTREDAGVAGA